MQRITALWHDAPPKLVSALFMLSVAAVMAVASGASFSIPYLGYAFILLGTGPARFPLLALPALPIAFMMLGKLWCEGGPAVAERGTS